MEPSIPGNPRAAFSSKSLAVSSALGALKYVVPKTCIMATTNLLTHLIAVLSPMAKWSSIRSAGIPYANILKAAVTF
jgi:hypothetical protein